MSGRGGWVPAASRCGVLARVARGGGSGVPAREGIAQDHFPDREAPLPVQSRTPVPAAAEHALGELVYRAAALATASGGNLLECFAAVPDPRDPRGIRHSLPCVLALCTAAVLCGNTQIEDVTAWVHAAPQEVLAAAGARRDAGLGAQLDAAEENLACEISTVVTAPFLREFDDTSWVQRVRNRLRRHGASMSAVWVKCDAQSMYDYIAHRGAARDAWKLSNWEEYLATIDPDFEPPFPHYTVDNRLNAAVALADQAREVSSRMKNEF